MPHPLVESRSSQCLICGSQDSKIWVQDYEALHLIDHRYAVRTCNTCGLKFIDPQPDAEESKVLYSAGFYASSKAKRVSSKRIASLSQFFSNRRAALLERYAISKGSILDVGCGAGSFLQAMQRKGWKVSGIDPSPEAQRSAPESLTAAIQSGHLKDIPASAVFDAITFWHSLEHVQNPELLIHEAFERLKPQGLLVISVPNGSGIGQWFGRRWAFLDIPRHLYHFSPVNLCALLKRNGFSIRREIHFLLEYSPAILLLDLLNLLTTRKMYLYYLLKRGDMGKLRLSVLEHAYNLTVSFVAGVFFSIPALFLSVLLAGIKKGDCYTVVAVKGKP